MSAMGTTAATSHLFARLQSKYGRVHFTGPGTSSAPIHTLMTIISWVEYESLDYITLIIIKTVLLLLIFIYFYVTYEKMYLSKLLFIFN